MTILHIAIADFQSILDWLSSRLYRTYIAYLKAQNVYFQVKKVCLDIFSSWKVPAI